MLRRNFLDACNLGFDPNSLKMVTVEHINELDLSQSNESLSVVKKINDGSAVSAENEVFQKVIIKDIDSGFTTDQAVVQQATITTVKTVTQETTDKTVKTVIQQATDKTV